MKIIATIIRNGLSRGIPEGTKVPEKPKYCKCSLTESADCQIKNCLPDDMWTKILEDGKYEKAVQTLWDSSVGWEDQDRITEIVWDAHPESDLYGKGIENFKKSLYKFRDGIYPLEGIDVEKIWQLWSAFSNKWINVRKENSHLVINFSGTRREVLRLIPQPNSEQKTIELKEGNQKDISTYISDTAKEIDLEEFTEHAQKLKFTQEQEKRIEGTEVSEPKKMHIKNGELIEEKKEPETCRRCNGALEVVLDSLTGMMGRCPMCSSEEPTHEEDQVKLFAEIYPIIGSASSLSVGLEKVMKLFTITRKA